MRSHPKIFSSLLSKHSIQIAHYKCAHPNNNALKERVENKPWRSTFT